MDQKGSVLIVEDDRAIADLYALKLRLDGFIVHHAADVATAEVVFRRTRPSLVCLDTRLPDASGVEAACTFMGMGARVVLLTNDQESYERPPTGVARSMLKSRTTPGDLSRVLTHLLATPAA